MAGLLLAACQPLPPDSDADIAPSVDQTDHRYGATPYAYPVVPPNGCIGDLCSIDGGTIPRVAGIWSVPISDAGPAQSYVPVYDTAVTQYSIRKLTLDDVGPAFAITSFTGGSTVEVGATVTNPAFSASYSSSAASASISNTDGLDSPHILSSPFTSATISGSFSHSAVATVVFTLTASAATTKTATSNIAFLSRTFSGVGTVAGTTGATASGNNAVLVGGSGTLTGSSTFGGLFSTIVGQSFGPFNPVGQNIIIETLHTATPHTWLDQNGFGVPMTLVLTFSFTNQNGSVLSTDIYGSTNLLSTTFTLTTKT